MTRPKSDVELQGFPCKSVPLQVGNAFNLFTGTKSSGARDPLVAEVVGEGVGVLEGADDGRGSDEEERAAGLWIAVGWLAVEQAAKRIVSPITPRFMPQG